jgi:hypothetical protein
VARLTTFSRETWCTACTLIRQHGSKATLQAVKATDACLAERDLDAALDCMMIAEAVQVLLTDRPEEGEMIH